MEAIFQAQQEPTLSEVSTLQRELWSERVKDWVEVQEKTACPLFRAVLSQAGIVPGTNYLDIGCGTGAAISMAATMGANVAGLDTSSAMLAIAKARTPQGGYWLGDMRRLPFPDNAFDLITYFNTIQYASDPVVALREARRTARMNALVIITAWGRREDTDLALYLDNRRLLLPTTSVVHDAFVLSAEGVLEGLAVRGGLTPGEIREVDCPLIYPDLETALRGLLSTGTAVSATRASGEERVRALTTEALAPYRLTDGSYFLRNRFRYLIARAKSK
jgi:SAM-dependent methyltransferase